MKGLWMQMAKLSAFGLACCCVLAACGVQEERLSVLRLEQVNRGELRWEVLIEKERGRAFVNLMNNGSFPIKCEHLGFRTILDFPVSYLEAGEVATAEFNRFIPAGEVIRFPPVVINDSERQIRSVQGGRFDRCRLATFEDACQSTQDIGSYREIFSELFDSFGADGCSDLQATLRRERVIDLRGKTKMNLDPLDLLSFGVTVLFLKRDVSSMEEGAARSRDSHHQVLVIADACADIDLDRLWRSRDCFPE